MTEEIDIIRKEWGEGSAKTITFIVTEDCQLRCKYCYVVGKNSFNKMDINIAKCTVDYILDHRMVFDEPAVIWDFIGGEPFLEVDLIDEICDYLKIGMYERSHPWFDNYRINITTNGLLYNNEKVKNFISKNSKHVSIAITVDGTKQKHDNQRVFPNGKGSYDLILKNLPLWLSDFPDANTKSTVSHDDLPYVKDSVLHLWTIGIKNVNINVVFEDVWEDGDDLILENQLKELADVIVDKELYPKFYCSFFQRGIGEPIDPKMNQNWCGAGKMLAIDHQGDFFPCLRFADFSLNSKPSIKIGNCYKGVDQNKLRPFVSLTRTAQSSQTCIDCNIASGCAWCQGGNYEMADTETIFQRADFICKMHKARVRANAYFWEKMDNLINV